MTDKMLMFLVLVVFAGNSGYTVMAAPVDLSLNSTVEPGGCGQDKPLLLDMASNSVDDQYDGCHDKMWKMVIEKYLPNEKNKVQKFKTVWRIAERNAKKPQHNLKTEHSMAIYVYTLGGPHDFYKDFNAAVREGKSNYKTTFQYHALHFLLTDAIQILHSNQKEECLTTYRRMKTAFDQNVLNKNIRFGSFASSSLGNYSSETFGTKSCFNITTCHGADLTDFSALKGHEREVLIPPYEMFNVTSIQVRKKKKDLECEVEYTLKSAGFLSLLNCALVK